MTGFARTEGSLDLDGAQWRWTWEIRSLNNRGLDLKCRLPGWLDNLEAEVRKRLMKKVTRGSVIIGLQLRSDQGEGQVSVNQAALAQVMKAVEQISAETECAPPTPDGILALRGVLNIEEDQSAPEIRKAVSAALLESFEDLTVDLVKARAAEGQKLSALVTDQIDEIERLTREAAGSAETLPDTIKTRLEDQLKDLLSETIEPARLAQEAALLAVKADVREELDRLEAHITAARQLLAAPSVIGRKFDFLVQEFNREANTLCSKAQTIELKQIGLDLKTVIDQMREQIQNIE